MDVELFGFFSECGVWDGICLWLSSVAEERDHRRQPHQIPVLHRRLLVPDHPQLHRIRGQSFHIRKKIEIHFSLQAIYLRMGLKYYLNALILHYDDVICASWYSQLIITVCLVCDFL